MLTVPVGPVFSGCDTPPEAFASMPLAIGLVPLEMFQHKFTFAPLKCPWERKVVLAFTRTKCQVCLFHIRPIAQPLSRTDSSAQQWVVRRLHCKHNVQPSVEHRTICVHAYNLMPGTQQFLPCGTSNSQRSHTVLFWWDHKSLNTANILQRLSYHSGGDTGCT